MSASQPTAMAADAEPPVKHKRKKSHRRLDFAAMPGVHRLTFAANTQKDLGCIAGEQCTTERPWKNIDKELFLEHLEFHTLDSEFYPLKDEITYFPRPHILVGYIPAESSDVDEYFVILNEKSTDKIDAIMAKILRVQQAKLENAINKLVGSWETLGSGEEVEEFMLKEHRALLEMEIETAYPILPFKVRFRTIKVQDIRDGYMELRPPEELPPIIFRRRIDASVQVTPKVCQNAAQTTCSYPSNSFTQYEYEIPKELTDPPPNDPSLKALPNKDFTSIYDILSVNGRINLYSNDYEELVLNKEYTTKISVVQPKEYLCFIDMNLHGHKMISAISWHPMWTGFVTCAYSDISPSLYRNAKPAPDEVTRAVHDKHPVLCWSFNDELKPKLILETHREVSALSYCPYDENLLIGGTVSGLLIIWDISNKLEQVEEEEILTGPQQHYRKYMFSLMDWMKNIYDVTKVRPTAISDLNHSHYDSVIGIEFLSPFHTISNCGKIRELDDDEPNSLQIMTASSDGCILIWDLKKKPVLVPGGFKATRKLKRLKKRPSALTVHESPYRMLHMNLRPIYKIYVGVEVENNRVLKLASFFTSFYRTSYQPRNDLNVKSMRLSDRIRFTPLMEKSNANPVLNYYVGTIEGDYLQGTWEGQEFDAGEAVNHETGLIISFGKYHDGPVTLVAYSPVQDAVLTVGGKVFAIWRADYKHNPVLWRKGDSIYTHGSWAHFEQASIRLVRIDGYIESWTLFYKSKLPVKSTLASNGAVTKVVNHKQRIKYDLEGLCDYRGSFRLFYNPHESPQAIQVKKEQMSMFLSKEVRRKCDFREWQTRWNAKYGVEVVETKARRQVVEEGGPRVEEPVLKGKEASAGMRYLETVKAEYKKREQDLMKEIILERKQLNTEELEKQREPLRLLEEEIEAKRKKQRAKLRDSEKIFKNTIVTLFPDVMRERPALASDPYEEVHPAVQKEQIFEQYELVASIASDYVEEHPFYYNFNWTNVLKAGRARRSRLDDTGDKGVHKARFAKIKEEKAKLEMMETMSIRMPEAKLSIMKIEEGEEEGDEAMDAGSGDGDS